ncbi:hypothetical protein [Piscirickettsia salmonis]|uniref:hypothetical protein n=1 Tax=Piscirickettsia salmonis TaxID=1238 RepID=UPI001FF0928E|nr:hypothetical protein [Piscirickettsia salmonis]
MAIVLSRVCAGGQSPYSHWRDLENYQLFFVEALIFKGVRIIPIDKLPADYEMIKTQVTLLGEAEAFILQRGR